jgi:integrase
MAWDEVDIDEAIWRIPPSKAKNKSGHTVPLIDEVLEILKRRMRELGVVDEQGEVIEAHTPWVFPSEEGQTGHLVDPRKQWAKLLVDAGLEDLRIHDLRRTMGSWQAGRKESLTIIGKALGHKSIQSTKIYARLDTAPVREAITGAAEQMLSHRGKLKLKVVK